jgi:hypothetical protein
MWQAARRRLAEASPRAVLAAAWLALVIYGYPGRMPRASVELLQHARASHPSVAALVWHVLEYVIAGPTGMLLAQVTLLVAGAYGILRATLPERRAAWLTAAFAVLPPILATATIISPQALAASLVLAGTAALLGARRRTGIALLGLAAGVDPTAVVAALPILVLLLRDPLLLSDRRGRAILIWLALAAAAVTANIASTRAAPAVHAPRSSLLTTVATIDPPTSPDAVLLRLGIPTERSHLQDAVTAVLDVVPWGYAPWLYLAGALALLVVRRRDRTAVALLVAGLGSEAVLLVTTADGDAYRSILLHACTLLVALRGRPR